MKNKSKASKIFWRIIVSTVGVALIFIAISNFALYFFGEKVMANVTTRQIGGANDQYEPNQRYEWSVGFTFTDKKGVSHSGHTITRGGDLPPKIDNRIYYFSFAPFISALEGQAKPNIGQLLYMVLGIILILVMNRKNNKSRLVPKIQNADNLKNYDDSVEELFHKEDD